MNACTGKQSSLVPRRSLFSPLVGEHLVFILLGNRSTVGQKFYCKGQ